MLERRLQVHRLHKAIYGLKVVSRAWNLQFHEVLIELRLARKYSYDGITHISSQIP
jgi:hypothetical protein